MIYDDKANTENTTMAKARAPLEDAAKFLVKRGLTRDRANYVTTLIKFRSEMSHLLRYSRDKDVIEALDGMCEIIGCEVEDMYEAQAGADSCKKK